MDLYSQWNMQLEKVFELEDLSRNTGSSDRYVFFLLVDFVWLQLREFVSVSTEGILIDVLYKFSVSDTGIL